ncbi:hypothetical protein GCM10009785_11080 [Brooklawnia cerclae]|uniref:Nucleotidyl transferase n=1 Tax=Brooklawnia cerclae TaxID=349934 RepID=A0ABX0SJV8_9ACTN|nr:hypothetical protein [Brooklawnia cerclae]NIH58663.1 hypothetical protein [Brooklawnia cerclae]
MNDGNRDLARDDVVQLLTEVGQVLAGQGLVATIYVVGGTAMSLTINSRRTTRDVDTDMRDHREELRAAAAEVAERHGLDPRWLNSAAAMFLSSEPDPDAGEMDLPGLPTSPTACSMTPLWAGSIPMRPCTSLRTSFVARNDLAGRSVLSKSRMTPIGIHWQSEARGPRPHVATITGRAPHNRTTYIGREPRTIRFNRLTRSRPGQARSTIRRPGLVACRP